MKIGILTLHRPSNYGANLQAYASVSYFTSLGHNVKIIDFTRSKDLQYINEVPQGQFEAHKRFVEARLPLTKQVFNVPAVIQVVRDEQFDVILVGADAVWRSPNDDCLFFFKWLYNTPDISSIKIASVSPAHMGNGFLNLNEKEKCEIADYLSKFSYISVRDEWTKTVINRDLFNGDEFVKIVNPDPVIILHRYIENEIWDSNGVLPKSYILMTLFPNWLESPKLRWKRKLWFSTFKRLVNKAGLKLIELPNPEGLSGMPFDYSVKYPIDPMQWFLWIKNARGFCGQRFHSIVSCISNGIPFYSFDNYGCVSAKTNFCDIMGFHRHARINDQKSKIYNLLKGTKFETFRTGQLPEFESPKQIFNILMDTRYEEIIRYRQILENRFDENMKQLSDSIQNVK